MVLLSRRELDLPVVPVLLFVRTGGEIQDVRRPRGSAQPEPDPPESVDRERVRSALQPSRVMPVVPFVLAERVQLAVAEVPDDQASAELPEIRRREGHSPRRIEQTVRPDFRNE